MRACCRRWWLLGLMTAVLPAHAQDQTYSYSVVHPLYGAIRTFRENIARFHAMPRRAMKVSWPQSVNRGKPARIVLPRSRSTKYDWVARSRGDITGAAPLRTL